MYKPEKLTIKNLLSHKETIFEFKDGIAVMVTGENKDDDGQESNGSGKSALIEGISIAITGKPFRKVKDMDMIHYGALGSPTLPQKDSEPLHACSRREYPPPGRDAAPHGVRLHGTLRQSFQHRPLPENLRLRRPVGRTESGLRTDL